MPNLKRRIENLKLEIELDEEILEEKKEELKTLENEYRKQTVPALKEVKR